MRKSTQYEIQNIFRKEFMRQACSQVLYLVYNYMDEIKLDTSKVRLDEEISNISFEIYMTYNNNIYEVAHYHYEDSMWIITHDNEVKTHIADSFKRILKLIKTGQPIDERN